MLERDQHFPEFKEIIAELNRLRMIAQAVQPALANVKRDLVSLDLNTTASLFGSTKGRERAGALSA
jgi:hypothetical protein